MKQKFAEVDKQRKNKDYENYNFTGKEDISAFYQIGPLGHFGLVVAMSRHLSVNYPLERFLKCGCSAHFCVDRVRFLVRISALE